MQLKHGKKIIYTRHRKFLKLYHPYRQLKQAFNGEAENEISPKPLTENEVYERLEKILTIFGKRRMQVRKIYGRKDQYSLIFHIDPF